MLFDSKKIKKMSNHLIGIDAEVYILYEDKVLLKSREKDMRHHFCSIFLFMNGIPLL